ncbi:MAG: hypothetical protein WC829_00785 [Hyphomicrobium sp.]|jgi:hypothetical protein
MGPPFRLDQELRTGTSAVLSHRDKYELLAAIATDLAARIDRDEVELDTQGYSPALGTRSFAALFETLVAEQYGILDGLRRAATSVFENVRNLPQGSTKRFFELAGRGVYGTPRADHPLAAAFPELTMALAQAHGSWFPLLRQVRTLTTHGEIGSCYRDRAGVAISYRHRAIREVFVPDAVHWLNETSAHIFQLTELFYRGCYLALEPAERAMACGMHNGLLYERFVSPSPAISLNDGRCLSRGWFEIRPGAECPMRLSCSAYLRPVPQLEREAHYGVISRS